MAGGGGGASEITLEFTPTWIVAVVCSVIVFISLFFERFLHYVGKTLKRKHQKPLFEALQKVKEELMLLGFISLLLTVFQGPIQKICIPESVTHHWLPCKREPAAAATEHFSVAGGMRRLLAGGGEGSDHCQRKGKVPLLSLEAIHQLHIFIFVLAITHVVLSLFTVLLGLAKIRLWRPWENSIHKEDDNVPLMIKHVHQFEFIEKRFKGFGKAAVVLSWLHSFFKQFYGSVTKSDYTTMRLGFIMTHCRGNPKFNFYNYMVRALEADFKRVVGISWYLWIVVVVFLLVNINGWHAYFWISFAPLVILLVVGTKLEHIITKLAHEVAEKHSAIEGDLIVTPSDDLFWFHRPKIVLFIIHFILFQNAFEIALFFWMLTTYGFDSCIVGKARFVIPRLAISVISQLLCSYSTLPLYAIVTQMGSSFKKAIFDEHVQEGLVGWAQMARKRTRKPIISEEDDSRPKGPSSENGNGITEEN
ncbi:MLO-like protein 1 [Typha angustifolia]|uniref:MLO-like protein 1 n=1 Tax=Typha angustifolia TaxID=59011 RepID=UPI003C2DACAC